MIGAAIPTPSPDQARLVDLIGRVSRLNAARRKAAVLPLGAGRARGSDDKTCIERGSGLMVTLAAGWAQGTGIASATGNDPAENVRRWRRWSLRKPNRWGESLIFGIPRPGDDEIALTLVGRKTARLPAWAELRSRGGIYMATVGEPGTGAAWLSFGLHKDQSPRQALAAIGRPGLWPSVMQALGTLLGGPASESARPWSIAVPVAGMPAERGIVRIGTTVWGRLPEDADKRARLAAQVRAFGGDPVIAESIYGLTAGCTPAPRAIGAAVEFDFEDQRLVGAHYTLRVPDIQTREPHFEGEK